MMAEVSEQSGKFCYLISYLAMTNSLTCPGKTCLWGFRAGKTQTSLGRGGGLVESLTPEREVWGSIPTIAVLCP